MWIKRALFERLIAAAAEAQGIAATAMTQIKVNETTQDWMRVRISQLEKERAQLFYQVSGVKIPIMEIERKPEPEVGANHPFNRLPSFEDMGDEEAVRQGIPSISVNSMLPSK